MGRFLTGIQKKSCPVMWFPKFPELSMLRSPVGYVSEFSVRMTEKIWRDFPTKEMKGISKDWVKRGEYYYYTKILEKSDSVDFFEKIAIPSYWTEEHASRRLSMTVQADAIQAKNFRPDFAAMSPWGNQEIELCVHERNGKLTCRKENVRLSVVFHGKAHKLMSVPDDFFINFQAAMPGDTFRDSVTVSNTTEKDAEIFFPDRYAEAECRTAPYAE